MKIKADSKIILYNGYSDKGYVFFQRTRIYPVDNRMERKRNG